jgi:NADH:ubiquinone oxidoreductase subunit 6 (subunit J)
MFELNEMHVLQVTQVLVIGSAIFMIMLWAVPALHRHILPPSLRNDAVARAATVACALVLAAVVATIELRGTTNAVARSDNAISVDDLQRTANTSALPSRQWDPY